MLLEELMEDMFLFLCHSFVVAILHSTKCPFWNVVGSKVFERTLLTTDAELVFHHLLPVIVKRIDFIFLVIDVFGSRKTTFFHGK